MLEIRVFKHFTQGVARSKRYSDMAVSPKFWQLSFDLTQCGMSFINMAHLFWRNFNRLTDLEGTLRIYAIIGY